MPTNLEKNANKKPCTPVSFKKKLACYIEPIERFLNVLLKLRDDLIDHHILGRWGREVRGPGIRQIVPFSDFSHENPSGKISEFIWVLTLK